MPSCISNADRRHPSSNTNTIAAMHRLVGTTIISILALLIFSIITSSVIYSFSMPTVPKKRKYSASTIRLKIERKQLLRERRRRQLHQSSENGSLNGFESVSTLTHSALLHTTDPSLFIPTLQSQLPTELVSCFEYLFYYQEVIIQRISFISFFTIELEKFSN